MKIKLFTAVIALLFFAAGITTHAQTQTENMYVYRNGNAIFKQAVAQIDSITFRAPNSESSTPTEGEGDVYIGVVAFHSAVSTFPISNNLEAAKAFISSKQNDVDRTALCYAVSKSVTLFDAAGLPDFDKIFVVSFTDGIDNGSSTLYSADGRAFPSALVYDTAHVDLASKAGLDAYTIGFGSQPLANNMQKLVIGKGSYKTATSSTLNTTFQEIANSVLASSKNVMLRTQDGVYTADYPKYIKFTITAGAYYDVIETKIVGHTLSVLNAGSYASFDAPVTGTINSTDSKIELPLNNLKFVYSGEEVIITGIKVEVSSDGTTYYEDVEDASASENISKRIAVVLVLDCSTSLGDNFAPMQTSANNFINTLAEAAGSNPGNVVGGGSTSDGFEMINVQGGTTTLNGTNVTLNGFKIGKYEVTQKQWWDVMGSWPSIAPSSSFGAGDNYPMYNVSYTDIEAFLSKLNQQTGKNYRLPTEAEWEYAAKGGQSTHNYDYSGSNAIGAVAWFFDNSGSKTHEVGTKDANELGIYDMNGNVWEWCYDWYGGTFPSGATNPTGASSGSGRVIRGGGWYSIATSCRVSFRNYDTPGARFNGLGFRLALPQ